MELADIEVVEFDTSEITAAYEWQRFMDAKNQGKKTKNLSNTKNVTGYLCHLAVEKLFERAELSFYTTRTQKYQGGDPYDIQYENDYIDVKGRKKPFSNEYFFHERMTVWDWHEEKSETYFAFAQVEPDFQTAYVYGIISNEAFKTIAQPKSFVDKNGVTRDYHYVWSRDLTPMRQYIFRV